MLSSFCKNRKYYRIYFSCFRHGVNHSSHSHFFYCKQNESIPKREKCANTFTKPPKVW